MINPNAQLLVAALRSGKYQQGKNQLATSDGKHCCLGVGCEVAIEHGVKIEKAKRGYGITYDGALYALPEAVRQWLGFGSDEGWLIGRDTTLAEMNDRGSTFAEIADIIESNPEGLFAEGEKQ